MQRVLELDDAAWYELDFQCKRLPWLPPILQVVSFIGSYPALGAVVLIVVVLLMVWRRWRAALLFGGTVLASVAVVELLKVLIARERPPNWTGPPGILSGTLYSFPSAHALLATVVYVGLALLLAPAVNKRGRILLLSGAVLLMMLVGASQLFLGYNYLSDVVAGWLGAGLVLLLAHELRPSGSGLSAP